jgi:CCR4-NOT transcriptional regulation complex NOT5 subunit
MEAFKTCERETNTKTYSKEGLMRAFQICPEQDAKQNTAS